MVDNPPDGRNRFTLGPWLFLRLLALVHLCAFVSFWVQLGGLVGPHGVLPAADFFHAAHEHFGAVAYAQLPSLCWLFGAQTFLHVLCAAGVVLSLLLFAGVAPAPCLVLLWTAYLSLVCAGQIFYEFQWDALLLETTLLAVFFAPWSWLPLWRRAEPPRLARWLVWWLLFRLMFLSGIVKLTSGDPTWRHLTALTFHYETQPLPTPLAWYACHLPAWFQRVSCAVMFFVELVAPFALFAPRCWRHMAVLLLIGLQFLIALTGNYAFFNLLTIALCLPCFDDAWLQRIAAKFPPAGKIPAPADGSGLRFAPAWPLRIFAGLVFLLTALLASLDFSVRLPGPIEAGLDAVGPFRSLNNYGLFAVMTTTRPEIIIEGSDDGQAWRPYEFRWKPGRLTRAPGWAAPYQPRLDWQMWFAAFEGVDQNRWVVSLCAHLLRGTPQVLALLGPNPFPEHPPRYIRAVLYDYHFTDRAARAQTGQWWRRTVSDFYLPPISLREDAR
ncbi:MAG TPA: lipase maturation factor family protein [Opitutaceae bacterium]|nr:lipase maturation factor family protein [Opitutaceae bacterium]